MHDIARWTLAVGLATVVAGCGGAQDPSDAASAADVHESGADALSGQWWRRHFSGGRSHSMRRNWNVGYTFFNAGDDSPAKWVRYMGAEPDVYAGALHRGPNERLDSWAALAGGNLGAPISQVMKQSQPDLHASSHMKYWAFKAPKESWGVLAMSTVPYHWKPAGKTFLDGWEQVGRGDFDEWYEQFGARLRYFIDHQTNKSPDSVILRPNWEMNQDTGFKPSFFANGGYIKLYNRMMKHFADSFRRGYGMNVPIIFAPAAHGSACLRVQEDGPCNGKYEDFFEYDGVYQLADVSYHPTDKTASTRDQIDAQLRGNSSEWFGLGADVIPLARKKHIGVSVVEWAPRVEGQYFAPLAPEAIDAFADLLEANSDIVAFTCAYHQSFVREDYWERDDTKGPIWKRAVQMHRRRFGAP